MRTAIQEPSRSDERWRSFLIHVGLLDLQGNEQALKQATERFQKQHRVAEDAPGEVGSATLKAAEELGYPPFVIGPDVEDIRECRPYFLIPLLELAPHNGNYAEYFARIKKYLLMRQDPTGKAVSDVYVLSHGWHRNLFAGVSAYDRLMSRFSGLFRRERLKPENPEEFAPLFITLHWHSDPGQDGWVDLSGRRDKLSFLTNIRAHFAVPTGGETQFINDFEDIFQFFTVISAPGVPALSTEHDEKAVRLLHQLDTYDLSDATLKANRSEKVAMAWRCYDEAVVKRVLANQTVPPYPFNSPGQAVAGLLKFVVATVGIFALLGALVKFPWNKAWDSFSRSAGWVNRHFEFYRVWHWISSLPGIRTVLPWLQAGWESVVSFFSVLGWMQILTVFLAGLLVLFLTSAYQEHNQAGHSRGAKGQDFPVVALAAWLPVQLVFTVIFLIPLLVTYLFGGVAAWALSFIPALGVPGLYDEKTDLWDWKRRRLRVLWGFPRYWLSALARWPITLLRNSLPADSQILSFVDGIDNQLAFFQMQIKGVSAGVQAAEFLNGLMRELEMEKLPRIHLIGHSFGGLLVANAVRTLANQDHKPKTTTRVTAGNPSWGKIESISTVCLLQGALASNWFDQEERIRNFVRDGNAPGRIAAIYSGYDTANGFYYPMANSSRMGAGYVGLYRAGNDKTVVKSLGKNGEFASLVKPPGLDVTSPPAISLDASRIIYEGPAATGGGHGDIFKDDVVNLLWAITNP